MSRTPPLFDRGREVVFTATLGVFGSDAVVRAGERGRYERPSATDAGWHICTLERDGVTYRVPVLADVVEAVVA